MAGGLFAFAKGSISPETIAVGRSVDGLVMVLLGGIQTLIGPLVGAPVFVILQDTVMRQTEFWRAMLGGSHPAAGAGVPGKASSARSRKWLTRKRASGAAMNVLSVRSLRKSFGGVQAVDDVSFEVEQGKFLALIGPNGAGKSTCFNMINGQLAPDAGEIRLAERQHRRPQAARDLAARRRPHVPGGGDVRLDDGGGERAARAG